MTPEQRVAFIAAGKRAEIMWPDKAFDRLTAAGFSISLDSVRDHTGNPVVWEVDDHA